MRVSTYVECQRARAAAGGGEPLHILHPELVDERCLQHAP